MSANLQLVYPDQLAFTVVTATKEHPLAKRLWLDENGDLQTTTVATLTRGTVTVEHATCLAAFGARLEHLETHQVVTYGIPALPHAQVATQDEFQRLTPEQRRDVITRSREHFGFAAGPGLLMLDFDVSGAPRDLLAAVGSPDQTREVLIEALPVLENAPMLWRPSSSSYIYADTRELHGLQGQRIYIPVTRASDIPTLGALLYARLWLLGYGYFVISSSGQLLDRTLVDKAVWQPERLDFAAGPICIPPVERRHQPPRLWNAEAPFFDARSAAGLTTEERRAVDAKRSVARAALSDKARETREAWAKERGKQIAVKTNVAEQVAVTIAREAAEHCTLRPNFPLQTETGEIVMVADLLANPERWHGERFRDPLEPDYRNDHRIAYANLRPGSGRPFVYSHAHGGVRYSLSHDRAVIRIADGDLPTIVDQCEQIIAAEGEMYRQKNMIVHITDEGGLARPDSAWLTDWLQRRAAFEKRRSNVWGPTDLPSKYAETILARQGELALPSLVAVTPGPFLRPDGSVVDQPGYDAATQVLYRSTGPDAPTVRQDMTRSMAEEALRYLWAPFGRFPFAEDVDRGVILALLLTAAVRPGIAIAPGGLIESHEAGSGKTLAAQAIANLTGVPAVPQAMAQHEEEIRKAIFAFALGGTSALFFDNVGRERPLDSASLAMVLTSGAISDRVLGKSIHAAVPFRSLMLFTGNNTSVVGDLNRRILRARIAPGVENPWTRVFDFCPRARTEASWLTLRVAALELIQAALRDAPSTLTGGSGYPEWDRLVRATVAWVANKLDIGVGFADPAQSLVSGYDDDPERDRLGRLLVSWHAVFGNDSVTLKNVLSTVDRRSDPTIAAWSPTKKEALHQLDDVLREIHPSRDNQRLGIYLKQQEGVIVSGMKLVDGGKRGGSRVWAAQRHGAAESALTSRGVHDPGEA